MRIPKAEAPQTDLPASAPLVFDYLDYRAFLRDYYLAKKSTRGLSYRAFSKRAGLASPNYLKLVIDGHRNLSSAMAARFAKAAGLDLDGARYFVELVSFTQAKTSRERSQHYTNITGFRRYREARTLEFRHAAYYSTWYLPAIRELAARHDFHDDPQWIAATLWPSIAPVEAAKALQILLELRLLTRDATGKVVQGEALLSTGPEVQMMNVATYHRTMMQRAREAIDAVAPAHRDISSLTLCLGADGLRRLKERVQRFRRELLELSTTEADPQQVVQVNFQLFPLSRGVGDE